MVTKEFIVSVSRCLCRMRKSNGNDFDVKNTNEFVVQKIMPS